MSLSELGAWLIVAMLGSYGVGFKFGKFYKLIRDLGSHA